MNRDDLHLSDTLPLQGCDIWTLYELSWLNQKGLPQVAIGEVSIPATSANLISSKSFKLYLNSYNQTRFASWNEVQTRLMQDLSACAKETVTVNVKSLNQYTAEPIVTMQGECIDDQDIEIKGYEFDDALLQGAAQGEEVSEVLHSHLLKSNCLITNPPDWGASKFLTTVPKLTEKRFCVILFLSVSTMNFKNSVLSVFSPTLCNTANHRV